MLPVPVPARKDVGGIILAIDMSKVDNARSLGFTANVVVEKMGTLLQLAIGHDGGVDDR